VNVRNYTLVLTKCTRNLVLTGCEESDVQLHSTNNNVELLF
jgi:hypothetical protein